VDLGSRVSRLSVGSNDDEYDTLTFDTPTVGYHSNAYMEANHLGKRVVKSTAIHGNAKVGNPYIIDLWTDSKGRSRVSIQMHLPSGSAFFESVAVRVSTDQKELVISFPMNQYMSQANSAMQTFFVDGKQLTDYDKCAMKTVMTNHSKVRSRNVSVSKVVQRVKVEDFFYEQRIPLPKHCMHDLASPADGDDFFHGKRFITYPDGSTHMHVELLSKVQDSYCPQEAKPKPTTHVASAIQGQVGTTTETARVAVGATILQNDSDVRARSVKRAFTDPSATASVPPPNHDDARREALRVLHMADIQQAHQQKQHQALQHQALQQQALQHQAHQQEQAKMDDEAYANL
jgi:hypothetical protein